MSALVLLIIVLCLVCILVGQRVFKKKSGHKIDLEELGRSTWTWLHSMAAKYPSNPTSEQQTGMTSLMYNFARFYPCEKCSYHVIQQMQQRPPEVTSKIAFENYLCWLHNTVNERLGKPLFQCNNLDQRWGDETSCIQQCSSGL